ncbi:biopolymer transporter ExbD [Acidovorax sp. NCPPB 2350]|nr:biopolymer transporter ExbD [Acidovorax sp. NCPPB 2350]
MAMQLPGTGGADATISSINTTPLVDVMLVLLIIFLITIPVVNFSVSVELPREHVERRESRPDDIVVTVDAAGRVYWFDTLQENPEILLERLRLAAAQQPQPELYIRGDLRSRYEPVGRLVYAAQHAGIARIGFITEPPARN